MIRDVADAFLVKFARVLGLSALAERTLRLFQIITPGVVEIEIVSCSRRSSKEMKDVNVNGHRVAHGERGVRVRMAQVRRRRSEAHTRCRPARDH